MKKKRYSKYKKLCDIYNIQGDERKHVIKYIVDNTRYKLSQLRYMDYDTAQYIIQSLSITNQG